MGIIQGTRRTAAGGAQGGKKYARGLYNFATDAGAQGDITLRGDTIPSGAIITDALIHVTTPVTGVGATVAIKVESAADINAADAISGAPWSTAGAKRADFTATTAPIITTAARSIVATVGTADLTAGKFTVVVEYMELVSQT